MFANRLGVLAIALVAELCAAGGSALLTLCVHEDGTVRYEPTLALCCKQNEPGQGECCSHEVSPANETHGVAPENPCQDYGVSFVQVIVRSPSLKQFLVDSPALQGLVSIAALVPAEPALESSAATRSCGPPRDHLLHDLSTVVLRI